jgi:hypothetical protein
MTRREGAKQTPPKQPLHGRLGLLELPILLSIDETKSARASAILCQAYLENYLVLAICCRIRVLQPNEQRKLFEGPAALFGTFNAKIEGGWALDLYGEKVRSDLHLIREIRNKFAHHLMIESYDHPDVAELCAKIEGANYLDLPKKQTTPRTNKQRYLDTCFHLAARFSMIGDKLARPEPVTPSWQIHPDY